MAKQTMLDAGRIAAENGIRKLNGPTDGGKQGSWFVFMTNQDDPYQVMKNTISFAKSIDNELVGVWEAELYEDFPIEYNGTIVFGTRIKIRGLLKRNANESA